MILKSNSMRKIYWTKLAVSDFEKNIEFLKFRWNIK